MTAIGYALFGKLARRLEDRFWAFKEAYLASGLEEPFFVYLADVLFFSTVTPPIYFILSFLFNSLALRLSPPLAAIASIPLTAALSIGTFGVLLYYPVYRRHSRRLKIESSLPFTVAYMAALASAGMGVERIIERALWVETDKEVAKELGHILRDVKVLGFDTATALDRASRRSPSPLLASFLVGLRSTYLARGDLRDFVMFSAKRFMSDKINKLRGVTNSLAMMSEVYVTLMVAAPLILTVMFVLMSLLGGEVFGLPPMLLIFVILTAYIPFSAVAMLIIIDGILSRA